MTDEERKARVHYHMYETCEGIAEHAERIVRLEEENAKLRELVRNLYACALRTECDECSYAEEPCDFKYDLRELGIEG